MTVNALTDNALTATDAEGKLALVTTTRPIAAGSKVG